jgi:hypothetical protein
MASRTRVVVMRPLRKRLAISSAFVVPLDRQAIVRPAVRYFNKFIVKKLEVQDGVCNIRFEAL